MPRSSSPRTSEPPPREESDISGVVLAGGASRRMGHDKAILQIDGETLLARAARHLREAGADPVVVASGRPGRLGPLAWPEVDDGPHAGGGPLAGILAALQARRTTPGGVLAVLAVDLPDASPAVLRWLASQWRADDAALVPVDATGRAQPLHGLVAVSPTVVEAIGGHLADGERRVQRVLAAVGARRLPVPDAVAPSGWSRNWNLPE